jgi:hypothetical protein
MFFVGEEDGDVRKHNKANRSVSAFEGLGAASSRVKASKNVATMLVQQLSRLRLSQPQLNPM